MDILSADAAGNTELLPQAFAVVLTGVQTSSGIVTGPICGQNSLKRRAEQVTADSRGRRLPIGFINLPTGM